MKAQIALLGCCLLLAACATPAPAGRGAQDLLGIEVEGVRLSAAGYMLDVRYRVVDPDKALTMFDRKTRPMLASESTGVQLAVPDAPKLGQLRTTGARNIKANRSYSILFANPGRLVERGAKLSLRVGDARIEGLTVQ
jgi:predicted small secreted protein